MRIFNKFIGTELVTVAELGDIITNGLVKPFQAFVVTDAQDGKILLFANDEGNINPQAVNQTTGEWGTYDVGTDKFTAQGGDDRLPKLIVFTNTQTITSTTETDITESVIAVEANSTYEIEVNFRVGCSGASGMQFGFKFPTGSTLMRTISGRTTGPGAQNISTYTHTSDTGLINMNVCTAATDFGNFTGKILLKVGSTAGNFIVTYGCVNGSQTSSIFENSYIKYTKFS